MKPRILKFLAIILAMECAVSLPAWPAFQDLGSLGKQAQSLGSLSGIAEKLHLTPPQLQQVLPILQREAPKLQAIKGSSNLSDDQKVAQTKAVQQQSDSKLKTILSPQQLLSLKDFRASQLKDVLGGAIPH